MLNGKVVAINPRRGMFVVAIDDGDFAVFELLDSIELSMGDRLQGNLEGLGGEMLVHLRQKERFSAYGQSGPSSFAACKSLL